MLTKTYNTFTFNDEPMWEEVTEEKLTFSHWDSEVQYNTFFKMCFVKDKGIFLKMRTDETVLRKVCLKTDEPVYEDSCMEFFIAPIEGEEGYINFEMNPNGVYLSQFGKGKFDRVFLKEITTYVPTVTAKETGDGWSLELFVPCELISDVFKTDFDASECIIKGNFYKCGDKTEKVHYTSFNEMTTLPPGFHNPSRFALICVKERN